MSDLFSRLEELSARLNQSSDSLNQAIADIEAKLASLRLGVEAWLEEPLEPDEPVNAELLVDSRKKEPDSFTYLYLGYARVNGTWHLVFKRLGEEIALGMEVPTVPLLQAPRAIRVKALKRLPELIKLLESKAETALKDVEQALEAARSIEHKFPAT